MLERRRRAPGLERVDRDHQERQQGVSDLFFPKGLGDGVEDDCHQEDEIVVFHRGCDDDEQDRENRIAQPVFVDVTQLEIHRPQPQTKADEVAVQEGRVEKQGQHKEPAPFGDEPLRERRAEPFGKAAEREDGQDISGHVQQFKGEETVPAEDCHERQFQ